MAGTKSGPFLAVPFNKFSSVDEKGQVIPSGHALQMDLFPPSPMSMLPQGAVIAAPSVFKPLNMIPSNKLA